MPDRPPPEIPAPGVPTRPDPWPDMPHPTVVPQVPLHLHPEGPIDRLRADRRLLLMGALDQRTADRLCAELMLADGLSTDPIELIVNCRGGRADAVFGVLDVISLLWAPLATCTIGSAFGTAALVLASGTAGRSAAPNATISLRVDDSQTIEGRAGDIRRTANRITEVWDRLAAHLATVSSLTVEQAQTALRDGGDLSLDDAMATGLIDEIVGR